jgi:hypothetical protein
MNCDEVPRAKMSFRRAFSETSVFIRVYPRTFLS